MARMTLAAGSRLHALLGRDVLGSEQLRPVDRKPFNVHRVVERYRRNAVFSLFRTSARDVEMRGVITGSLLPQELKDKLLRRYRDFTGPTLSGVCATVRRLEVEAFGEAVVRADGEQMLDRYTALRESHSEVL